MITDQRGAYFGKNLGMWEFPTSPGTATAGWGSAQAFSSSGIQVALADGSVRTCAAGMSVSTWQNALTPAGGTVNGPDWTD